MKLNNIIEFRDWLFDFTANMSNDHIIGEQEVLYIVKDKFSSLGLNDNKIDKEPIDEKKLNELATEFSKDEPHSGRVYYGYINGYRDAMEG